MGYFDPAYLRSGSVMVLKQHGNVVAYISILKSFVDTAASIDQLRALPDAPSTAMHFLLGRTIEFLYSRGKMTLNIGLAPLSGINKQDGQPAFTNELLKIVRKLGSRYYSFQGVEQFKNKSQPAWHPRYLYYTGGVMVLPGIVWDIEQAAGLFIERRQRQRVAIGVAALITALIMLQFL
jgi:phosphatidylglycerol lysyltransferase